MGGEVSQPGRGRPEARRPCERMQALFGRGTKGWIRSQPDTALLNLPSGKDVQEVEDENGRELPLRRGSRNLPPHVS